MKLAELAVRIVEFLTMLVALWRAGSERRAGRTEAILEQKERTDAAVRKADLARIRARERDAAADGLHENDGFRRD